MGKLALSLLFVTGSLLTLTAAAAPLPDFKASYRLEQHNLRIGTATLKLQMNKQGVYRYEFNSWPNRWVSWLVDIRLSESSRGRVTAGGIRPDEYLYQRSGSRRREANLIFDWQSMTVENHVADSHWEMDIPAGTIDKLATQMGAMIALGRGAKNITFTVADGGTLKEYQYQIIGRETLDVPAGTFKTVKVTKLRKDIDQETIIWFAPALHYLPVRIWQRDSDDDEYRSELEEYSPSLLKK